MKVKIWIKPLRNGRAFVDRFRRDLPNGSRRDIRLRGHMLGIVLAGPATNIAQRHIVFLVYCKEFIFN